VRGLIAPFFIISTLLLIVIAVAGLVFGEEAARSEIFNQLDGMLGTSEALAVLLLRPDLCCSARN